MLMRAVAEGDAFALEPSLGFLVLSLYGAWCVIGGMMTALKGRWGLFCLGLLTAGLIWPVTALVLAKADSPWGRSFYGPAKLARARARERR